MFDINVRQKCSTKMFDKNVDNMFDKNYQQKCSTKMFNKNVQQKCSTNLSTRILIKTIETLSKLSMKIPDNWRNFDTNEQYDAENVRQKWLMNCTKRSA